MVELRKEPDHPDIRTDPETRPGRSKGDQTLVDKVATLTGEGSGIALTAITCEGADRHCQSDQLRSAYTAVLFLHRRKRSG